MVFKGENKEWHRWFAWFPVFVGRDRYWLQTVERRWGLVPDQGSCEYLSDIPGYEYRPAATPTQDDAMRDQ